MFLISLSFITLTGIIQISCCRTGYKVAVLVENDENWISKCMENNKLGKAIIRIY